MTPQRFRRKAGEVLAERAPNGLWAVRDPVTREIIEFAGDIAFVQTYEPVGEPEAGTQRVGDIETRLRAMPWQPSPTCEQPHGAVWDCCTGEPDYSAMARFVADIQAALALHHVAGPFPCPICGQGPK